MQENLKKKAQLSNKIFPWFSGLSGDLIFFIAIDTLFLTQVKDLNASQNKVKLLIQYDFSNLYSTENVAIYLGFVVLISRIGRILSNMIFEKVYPRLKDKLGIILSFIMCSLFIFTLSGHFFGINQYLKNTLMTIGFILILALRDPFRIYIHDLILRVSPVEKYQKLIYISNVWSKICEMVLELLATVILLKGTLEIVLILFFIIACVEAIVSIKLYKEIKES